MADTKISGLPAVTTPGASDELAIVNGGVTKRVTIQNLVDAAPDKRILGSTAGNIIRATRISVTRDTSGANGIKCFIADASGEGFNVSSNMEVGVTSAIFVKSGNTVIGSGATEVTFSLDATGARLTTDLVEPVTNILSANIVDNNGGISDIYVRPEVISGNIRFDFRTSSGAAVDLTTFADTKVISVNIVFVIGGAI